MKIGILPVSDMVATTGEWLSDPVLEAEITAHPLGAALWKEIQRIHEVVVESNNQRMSIKALVAALVERIGVLDATHDRKARALRNLLLYLAEATDDAALARILAELDALLFPHQLRIVQLPYRQEAGEVMQVEKRVTAAVRAKLASIRVADQTLADIYDAWIAAGKELGRCVSERARLEASLGTEGTTASRTQLRQVRTRWIRGVRLLLDGLDVLELSDDTRERLLAPLEKAILEIEMRRSQNGQPSTPDPDTIDPDIDDVDDIDDIDDLDDDGVELSDDLGESILDEPGEPTLDPVDDVAALAAFASTAADAAADAEPGELVD